MLRNATFLFILICFVGCKNSSEKDNNSTSDHSISNISEEKDKKYPFDLMFMQRAYPSGEINSSAYSEAIQWKKQIAKTK